MSAETTSASRSSFRRAAEDAVAAVARAMKNVSFYEVSHPVVADVVGEATARLGELLEREPEFLVKFSNGYVVLQESPLVNPQVSIGNLVGACRRRGVDTLVFLPGVREQEIAHLVEVLAADPAQVETEGGVAEALAARGVRRIVIERLVSEKEETDTPERPTEWRWVYATALDVLRGAAAEVRLGRPIDVASVQSSVREIVDDVLGDRSITHSLNSMKGMDEYTFVHALHICILGLELGRQLGFSRSRLEELGAATLLHDVGKIFVPLSILRKPEALDADEFAVIARHPLDGALVLSLEKELPPVASLVAFEHHIHCDHSGYPKMRRPRPLNAYSLMTSIADVYDALTTARPYRPPLTPHAAVATMQREYEGRMEPRLLAAFLELLGPHPWGTLVRAADGRLGVVTRPSPADPANPGIRVIEMEEEGPRVLDGEMPLQELDGYPDKLEVVDPLALGIDLTELFHRSGAGETAPPSSDS